MTRGGHARARLAGAVLAMVSICGLAACARAVPETPPPDLATGAGARAFADTIGQHNRAAIDLAGVAAQRGEHPQTRSLAARVLRSRTLESQRLGSLLARLRPNEGMDEPRPPVDLSPTSLALAELGVSARELGLPPPPGFSVRAGPLDLADPFDRSFIDAFVALDRGALALAEGGLRVADDPESERLARSMIRTRICEIQALNAWRRRWYGLRSPSGGVPATARLAVPARRECS